MTKNYYNVTNAVDRQKNDNNKDDDALASRNRCCCTVVVLQNSSEFIINVSYARLSLISQRLQLLNGYLYVLDNITIFDEMNASNNRILSLLLHTTRPTFRYVYLFFFFFQNKAVGIDHIIIIFFARKKLKKKKNHGTICFVRRYCFTSNV